MIPFTSQVKNVTIDAKGSIELLIEMHETDCKLSFMNNERSRKV